MFHFSQLKYFLFLIPVLIFGSIEKNLQKEIKEHPVPSLCTDSATDAVRVRVIGSHFGYGDLSKVEVGIDCVVLRTLKGSAIKEKDEAIFYQTQYYSDSILNIKKNKNIAPGKEYTFCLRKRRKGDVVYVDSAFVHLLGGADTSEFEGLPWIIPKRKNYVILNIVRHN